MSGTNPLVTVENLAAGRMGHVPKHARKRLPEVMIAASPYMRLRGLTRRDGFKGFLMLVPCKSIHTYTMKQPIDVAFIGSDGCVITSVRRLKPNNRIREQGAVAVIERFSVDGPWYERGDFLSCIARKRCL